MEKRNLILHVMLLSMFITNCSQAMENIYDMGRELILVVNGYGDLKEIERLIREGAPVNYLDKIYDTTPLLTAIQNEFHSSAPFELTRIKTLIAAGAQVDLANTAGWTPLMLAIFNGNHQICELLIDAMLKIPTKEQKKQMVTLFGIDKFRKNLCPYGLDNNLRNEFKVLWPITVHENNKHNFANSFAYQEIMRIKSAPNLGGPDSQKRIAALLEKYNPGGNNTKSESWCSVQ